MNKIRKNSLVTVNDVNECKEYPFINDLPLVFLGEIVNMPGHGIFVGNSGKCYVGFHIWNFRELTEDEV